MGEAELFELESLLFSVGAIAVVAGVYVLLGWVVLPLFTRNYNRPVWWGFLLKSPFYRRLGLVIAISVLLAYGSAAGNTPLLSHELSLRILQALLLLSLGVLLAFVIGTAAAIYRYSRFNSGISIRGYAQLAQLAIYIIFGLLAFSVITQQAVVYYLSGIGALLAVVLLIFRDTILSFIATIQINQTGLLKRGDWVEIPEYGADGEITDIQLHTFTVQNWDKTIVTVPTHKAVTTPLKNWRGMEDAGGRRIKRSIYVDISSIRLLAPDEQARFARFKPLRNYMQSKLEDLDDYHAKQNLKSGEFGEFRQLTNVGTFRAYIINYLASHPDLDTSKFTALVRQLPPSRHGLPIEIYVFTNTTDWIRYESIQADIFDHLLGILPEFDLRAYQDGLLEGISRQGVNLAQSPAVLTSGTAPPSGK